MAQTRHIQKWGWLLFLLGMLMVLAWDWLGEPARPSALPAMTAAIVSEDINQHRLNSVPPSPNGRWLIQQTFVPAHDGLSEIELILARNGEPDPAEDGRFTLTLFDANEQLITEQTLESGTISHNDTYNLTFPPQKDSAGQTYRLQLSGSDGNPVTVWGYDLNVHDAGEMTLIALDDEVPPDTAVADLRFITRYELGIVNAFTSLINMVWRDGVVFLLTLLFLPLPGVLLMRLRPLRWRRWDPLAWVGTSLVLGTAVWPLLWYGFSLLGGRWSGWLLWLVVIAGWASFAGLQVANRKSHPLTPSPPHLLTRSRWHKEHTILILLLLIGLAVRLLAVRDLAAPPWVDAGRHALITAVMIENGQTISDYAPYLPEVDRFPYHFGFHTISASLILMSSWDLARLLLVLGQLINALIPLAVYTAVWLMTRRRGAALLAAFLTAIPFFFPAYYATWGRFTQLTAMFIMPVLLAFTWLLLDGSKRWKRAWWVIALLAAGLFLVHFRVFLFYVPFAALVWLIHLGRHGRWLALAGLTAWLLILPRLIYLNAITEPARSLRTNLTNYNNFPLTYFNAGWDRYFVWLAGVVGILLFIIYAPRHRLRVVGLIVPTAVLGVYLFNPGWEPYFLLLMGLIGLLSIMNLVWQQHWAFLLLTQLLWAGLLFLLLAGDYLNLPSSALVNLNSMYITLFLPLAIFLGVALERLWRWLRQSHWVLLSIGYVAAGVGFTAVCLFGLQQQTNILNEQTILVKSADLPALTWLEENLPAEANVAVSSWKWLGETWAGSDGGAWIVPLTRHRSSTPPADYNYNRDLFEEVREFNEAATAVADWSTLETAVWLKEQGITHLFVGARGGFLDPAALAQNPQMQLLYAQEGVFIFEIK